MVPVADLIKPFAELHHQSKLFESCVQIEVWLPSQHYDELMNSLQEGRARIFPPPKLEICGIAVRRIEA